MSKVESKSGGDVPPCRILFRSKTAVELYTVQDNTTRTTSTSPCVTLANGLSKLHAFAPDGSNVAIHLASKGVQLVNLQDLRSSTTTPPTSISLPNTQGVQYLAFSSKGSYLLTWEKLQKSEGDKPPPNNLKVWCASSGTYLHGFALKNMKRSQWPPLKWTHDEKIAFYMVTNEVQVYDGLGFQSTSEMSKSIDRIRCTGATSFSVPSSYHPSSAAAQALNQDKYFLTTFVPETKGKPARISLLRYPNNLGDAENPKSGPVLATKSFFQAEECNVQWSPKGDAVLALTQTSVDASGESYYGSTNLYLLLSEARGSTTGEALGVPLPKSSGGNGGPVLDVSWMPNPKQPSCFAVISGRMPALTSLHAGHTAEATFLFGNAHRNTIIWSDHGRFLAVGGFGNLAGGMDFYDRNKLKAIPQYHPVSGEDMGTTGNTASCAVGYGWSPCSRYFMVSTTTPRMNVDNGVALYKYNGLQLKKADDGGNDIITWDNAKFQPDSLLAAEFVPAPVGFYPDRPQSPSPSKRTAGSDVSVTNASNIVIPTGKSASSAGTSAASSGKTAGAYVPPAGRYVPPGARKAGGGMSLAEKMRREREGSNVGVTKVTPSTGTAGTGAPAGGKSKTQLKKERQKLAKQKAQAAAAEEEQKKAEEEKARLEAAKQDPVKRSKKLKKTLKAIEDLKTKDLSTLNEDQRLKLATEEAVRKELAELGL